MKNSESGSAIASKPTSSAVRANAVSCSIGPIATLQVYFMVSAPRLLGRPVRGDNPHRVVLRAPTVGVAEGFAGPGHLVIAALAHHLDGGLGEPDHPRGADRVARQHPAGGVDRQS